MLYEDFKVIICKVMCIILLTQKLLVDQGLVRYFIQAPSHISLPIKTSGKPLAAISKFPNAIGKLIIGKTLATSAEEITNAMIGNDVLATYW